MFWLTWKRFAGSYAPSLRPTLVVDTERRAHALLAFLSHEVEIGAGTQRLHGLAEVRTQATPDCVSCGSRHIPMML